MIIYQAKYCFFTYTIEFFFRLLQGVFILVFMGVLFLMALKDELGAVYLPGEKTVEMKALMYSLIFALGSEIILTAINIVMGIYFIVQRNRSKKIRPSRQLAKSKITKKVKVTNKRINFIRWKSKDKKSTAHSILESGKNKKIRKKLKKFKKNPTTFKLISNRTNSTTQRINLMGADISNAPSDSETIRFSHLGANVLTQKHEASPPE